MQQNDVYLGLGGNVGDSWAILTDALRRIAKLSGVSHVETSRFFRTAPWNVPPQRDYINAVCRVTTTLSIGAFAATLQTIERLLGKQPKPKECPRAIDIDILFFGTEYVCEGDLQIPHPRWRERLFVIAPLADLIDHLPVPVRPGLIELVDIQKELEQFAPWSASILSPLELRELSPTACSRPTSG